MKIEIRRNRDITFSVTCVNPESLKSILPEPTEEERRIMEENERERLRWESELFDMAEEPGNEWHDLDGTPITRETHEVGYEYSDPVDGVCYVEVCYIRPKKSELSGI